MNIRPYRYPAMQKMVIEGLIKDILKKRFIQMSCSPFASPLVLVKKKDGGWRLCVNYRSLNKLTIKNRYQIPLIEDLFDKLRGARIFSKLDIKSGYHQIRLEKKISIRRHSKHTPATLNS